MKPSKEVLYHLYWERKLSQRQIAEMLGLTQTYIGRLMRRYGIERRNRSQAMYLAIWGTETSRRDLEKEKILKREYARKRWDEKKEIIKAQRLERLKKRKLERYGFYRNLIDSCKNRVSTQNEKLAYIAGMLDGDGCISGSLRVMATEKGTSIQFVPVISISNNNKEMLDFCTKVLDEIGVKTRLEKHQKQKNIFPTYSLQIFGLENILRFLCRITPFIVGKRRQAELLMEFVYSRLITGRRPFSYTDEEKKIISELKRMKTHRKTQSLGVARATPLKRGPSARITLMGTDSHVIELLGRQV